MTKLPYRCPYCDREYSSLDCLGLQRTPEQIFLCEYCNVELILDQGTNEVNNDVSVMFMDQCRPILELLKLTDGIILPAFKPVFDDVVVKKDVEIKKAVEGPANQVVVTMEGKLKAKPEKGSQRRLLLYAFQLLD